MREHWQFVAAGFSPFDNVIQSGSPSSGPCRLPPPCFPQLGWSRMTLLFSPASLTSTVTPPLPLPVAATTTPRLLNQTFSPHNSTLILTSMLNRVSTWTVLVEQREGNCRWGASRRGRRSVPGHRVEL
jgi:hypothetical protein